MFEAALTVGSQPSPPRLLVYPERAAKRESTLERLATAIEAGLFAKGTVRRARRLARIVPTAARHAVRMGALDTPGLQAEAREVAAALKRDPRWPEPVVARAFALVREAASRLTGQRHHDVQLIGGYAMLRGMIAEMGTGEGKTLTASLPVATAGLAGIPTHVVTVNGYLAERDAALMRPLYEFLGLTVGVVTDQVPAAERGRAYRCDITYCTNKDVAFDYMRDRLSFGRRMGNLRRKAAALLEPLGRPSSTLLHGLHFAVVDEVDSVLIDEARTPLILSGETDAQRDESVFDEALKLARGLQLGIDFQVFGDERRVGLLASGRRKVGEADAFAAPWNEQRERERLIDMALTALHMLNLDEHYLVRGDKIEIIDEFSGRTMPDRTWTEGLQELVERKEGLPLSARRGTRARMTYQRFFRRYRRLAGMTGTAKEVAAELWRVYRLPIATIPPNRPDRRIFASVAMHLDAASKWRAIAAAAAAIRQTGAPVLVGTRTVAASLQAAAALEAVGLPHTVLSAAQDKFEAEIVAAAGRPGAVTIATNMAGRGTDIRMNAEALAAGGLHVIMSELHEAKRIDRQLAGRCGRQGDPGLVQTHVSLEDPVIERHCPPALIELARRRARAGRPAWIGIVARFAQARAERLHAGMRRDLLKSDEWLGDATAFTGDPE